MILDPRGYDVVEWTDYLNLEMGQFGLVPRLDDEKKWREWAATVIAFPAISGHNPPNPYQFEDWREWAFRFNQVIETLE